MARKKKKRSPASKSAKADTQATVFNPAIKERVTVTSAQPREEAGENSTGPADAEAGDTETFLQAMADVRPLEGPRKTVIRPPDVTLRPAHPAPDDELEAMAHLSDLVSGAAELDITWSDEYIEGCVHGIDRKLMQRLRKGRFSIQDYVDLHGLTRQEAQDRVRRFLMQSYQQGMRSVLIVHGRGLNSENHIPILKERLPLWLTRGPVRKIVLAFSTARPYDGGSGALYILLRKQKGGAPVRLGPVS